MQRCRSSLGNFEGRKTNWKYSKLQDIKTYFKAATSKTRVSAKVFGQAGKGEGAEKQKLSSSHVATWLMRVAFTSSSGCPLITSSCLCKPLRCDFSCYTTKESEFFCLLILSLII